MREVQGIKKGGGERLAAAEDDTIRLKRGGRLGKMDGVRMRKVKVMRTMMSPLQMTTMTGIREVGE